MHRADLEKCLLQRMQPPVLLQPFDRRDFFLADFANLREAGVRWRAVDQHRARAALAFAASVFCAGQLEVVPQHAEQAALRVGLHAKPLIVNVKFGDSRHTMGSVCRVSE